MTISVQNIYYMLCYAWDRLGALGLVDVGAVPGNRVENLLGKVLQHGVAHLIRRGLDQGYIPVEEEGRRLRGKLSVSQTVRRMLLPRGQVACQADELSHDVPHNRVLKAAMRELMSMPSLDRAIRSALHDHCNRMHEVSDVELSTSAFRHVQLHQNLTRYSLLVNVARLVAEGLVPDERGRGRRFHPFTANPQAMGRLFERFVRNFLRREQTDFDISSPVIPWQHDQELGSDSAWLPDMLTDVVLRSPTQRVVIEAKYYAEPYSFRYGSKKLRSNHLYQLLTYMTHMEASGGPRPVGVLLYAGGAMQPLEYRLGGHQIFIRSVDLDRDWQLIHQDLLELTAGLRRE
jgi:5-methylcytosine-specific restriction enzyme subunit McrC